MALPPTLDDENLYKFRTKICERYVKQGRCEFADRCQYSHDLRWTRRPPWKYNYCPELCHDLQFVKDGRGRTIAKSNCKQKRNCKFAHTKEEQVYHPKMYKTIMCKQFQSNAWCDRYYCPFAHALTELRSADLFYPPSKVFGSYEDQDDLCPDIYLPSDKPHPRLRARFLAIMDSVGPGHSHHFATTTESLANQNRTRHPYTDFISSHTPQSVLSDTHSPSNSTRIDGGTSVGRQTSLIKEDGESRVQKPEQNLVHSTAEASTFAHAQEHKRGGEPALEQKKHNVQHPLDISGGTAVLASRKNGVHLLGSVPLKHPGKRTLIKDSHIPTTVQNGGSILGNPGKQIPRRPSHCTNCCIPLVTASPHIDADKQSSQSRATNCAVLEKNVHKEDGCVEALHTERLPLLPTSALSAISDATRSPTAATPFIISCSLQPQTAVEGSPILSRLQGSQEGDKLCSPAKDSASGTPPGVLPQNIVFGDDSFRPMCVSSTLTMPQPVGKSVDSGSEHETHETMVSTAAVQSPAEPFDRYPSKFDILRPGYDEKEAIRRPACGDQITNRTRAFFVSSKQGQSGSLKQLVDDTYFWKEPIGQSRDDPSVMVFSGVILGSNTQSRETVAIKQVPVVVTSRMRASYAELEQFAHIHDPLIVNTKGVYCIHNDDDEGMSLMLVLEKCEGCLADMIAISDLGARCLQEPLPPQGMTEMLSHLLSGVLKIQQYGHSAHMRIHPGNIMLTENFELKVGDCAGKIRYLSIFDLLHAGIQGAKNARELIHWILSSPQEAAWLAPEFIRSLLHLAQQISVHIDQYEGMPPENRKSVRFSVLAYNLKWPSSFLQKADAWSTGATLFYIVSGGLHPYGDPSDHSIISHILEDRKVNLDKIRGSPLLYDLIEGLLESDPDKRTSLSQALCHAAFWKMGETEHFLKEFQLSVETNPESHMVLALSDPISWISSLASAPSSLCSVLVSYLTSPSCLSLLTSSLGEENSVSFLLFLALLSADSRLPVQERRSLVSSALLLHPSAFLKAVRLMLFPRIPENPVDFVISRNSTYVKQYLGEGMRHAIRNTVPQHHKGLLGAPPSGSHPASAPAFIPMYHMGFPASSAPVTSRGGSQECDVTSETHSQTEDCQRLPPPPRPVSSYVLPTQPPRFPSTSTGCAELPSSFSRRSNHPNGCSPTSSVPVDFPGTCSASSWNLGPSVGSSAPSKKLNPTMIPQVQALMNAARAMQPSYQTKLPTAHENNAEASSMSSKGDGCNSSQRLETHFADEPVTSDLFAATRTGLSLACPRSKLPDDRPQQPRDKQSVHTVPVPKNNLQEANLDSTIAGLSWRLSHLEMGGRSGQEHSGDDFQKESEILKDGRRQIKVSGGSATKVPSRGVKSVPKLVSRSQRSSGSCHSATGNHDLHNDEYTDPSGKLVKAPGRIRVAELPQRPNPTTNTNPGTQRDCCPNVQSQRTTVIPSSSSSDAPPPPNVCVAQ